MKLGIASDHRGYKLKCKIVAYLQKKGHEVMDFGTTSIETVDYTNFGFRLGEAVAAKQIEYGIAICGTGIGISIACNKVNKVRCAKVDTPREAVLTRRDNDANILALNGTMNTWKALDIVDAFLKTPLSDIPRYQRRIQQILDYETAREENEIKTEEPKEK